MTSFLKKRGNPRFFLTFLRQHRTIASARFGGSFPPILRFEKLEIHTVFLRFSNLGLTKNLSPNLLAELCGAALRNYEILTKLH